MIISPGPRRGVRARAAPVPRGSGGATAIPCAREHRTRLCRLTPSIPPTAIEFPPAGSKGTVMTGDRARSPGGGDLVIIGSGGFGREAAQAVHALNECRAQWRLLGYLDAGPAKPGGHAGGIPGLGC